MFVDHQDPQILLCQAAFQPVGASIPVITPPEVQELAFPFVEFNRVSPVSPFLQFFKSRSEQQHDHLERQPLLPILCCQLADEDASHPIIQDINGDVQQ